MSVPVSLERLREAMVDFGPAPFLLTVSGDGRPHAVGVVVAWDGEELVAPIGRSTAVNTRARPLVSLVWAPYETGGYSLIVDGDGAVSGEDAAVRVRPTKAVLHRAAAVPAANANGCISDCVPLTD